MGCPSTSSSAYGLYLYKCGIKAFMQDPSAMTKGYLQVAIAAWKHIQCRLGGNKAVSVGGAGGSGFPVLVVSKVQCGSVTLKPLRFCTTRLLGLRTTHHRFMSASGTYL
jgi:hypothetical protein